MRNRIILIVLLLAILIGGYMYFRYNYLPKYQWDQAYRSSGGQPYDLDLFYSIVKKQSPRFKNIPFAAFNKMDTSLSNSNLIVTGELNVGSFKERTLMRYMARGNKILVISDMPPFSLATYAVPVGSKIKFYSALTTSLVTETFSKNDSSGQGALRFYHRFLKDTSAARWHYYPEPYFRQPLSEWGFSPLSYLNDSMVNGWALSVGKGKLIACCNPALFANIHLAEKNGLLHTNRYLAQLHKGPTFWMGNAPDDDHDGRNATDDFDDANGFRSNPLQFLFSNPRLKWGWYLFLTAILLYLIFRSKREQRIIPILPVNTNSSIEYTKAIGALYFKHKGHHHIAHEMYLLFLAEIRNRYNITTDLTETELINQLSIRSGVEKTVLFHLFKQFRVAREVKASGQDLALLYNNVENYHKKRK